MNFQDLKRALDTSIVQHGRVRAMAAWVGMPAAGGVVGAAAPGDAVYATVGGIPFTQVCFLGIFGSVVAGVEIVSLFAGGWGWDG